ncbi:NTP transferase domain-containing protein [Erythrobacter sp. MTPC3]|uniref:nucleotidyltransferase family protein n=1 Tax=Erythrobacter sp. MTPC3 TaxID=3056564 RepID=UPI0036F2D63F
MPEQKRLAAALLAAGASRRFGAEDKLAADFRGKMLGIHAAQAMGAHRFYASWVITSRLAHPCDAAWQEAGFQPQCNGAAEEGMGTSAAMAARLAMEAGADALLIALADMPLVPSEHFGALIGKAECHGPDFIAGSRGAGAIMPPAVFGSHHFRALARLGGDAGARDILKDAEAFDCAPHWLIDIDTPEALAALERS